MQCTSFTLFGVACCVKTEWEAQLWSRSEWFCEHCSRHTHWIPCAARECLRSSRIVSRLAAWHEYLKNRLHTAQQASRHALRRCWWLWWWYIYQQAEGMTPEGQQIKPRARHDVVEDCGRHPKIQALVQVCLITEMLVLCKQVRGGGWIDCYACRPADVIQRMQLREADLKSCQDRHVNCCEIIGWLAVQEVSMLAGHRFWIHAWSLADDQ